MRLIDADALSEAMYRKSFEADDGRQRWDGGLWIRYKIFEEARDEATTVDAVPVVRCKDCTYYEYSNAGDFCSSTGAGMPEDGYCSDGERKAEP